VYGVVVIDLFDIMSSFGAKSSPSRCFFCCPAFAGALRHRFDDGRWPIFQKAERKGRVEKGPREEFSRGKALPQKVKANPQKAFIDPGFWRRHVLAVPA
jgi:hypothetical protein